MVLVVLFVNGEVKDKMIREVAPGLGDTIVIDCGEMVKVTEVSHQWDDPTFVQVNAREAEDGNILFRLTEEDAEKVIDYLDGLNEERIPLTAKLVEQLIDQGGHDPTPAEFFEKSEEPT